MQALNRVLKTIADLALRPWASESPWPALAAASLWAAVIFVGLFRLTSNQAALRQARNRFIARVMELVLFRHDLRVSLTACGRIFAANLRYLREFARPLLVGAAPMLLLLVQLAGWFEFRPLRVGETAVLEVELDRSLPVLSTPVELSASPVAQIDSPAVRDPDRNEIAWRLRGVQSGAGTIDLKVAGQTERKQLVVGTGLERVSTQRVRSGLWRELLHPAEPPLAIKGPIVGIKLHAPQRDVYCGDRKIAWELAAFVLLTIFSLLVGRLLGVRIA